MPDDIIEPLPESHLVFTHSDAICQESEDTLADRWHDIVVTAPELGIPFYEFSKIIRLYERAYQEESGERLYAYLEHSYLLAHYLNFLNQNDMILAHAYACEMVRQHVWMSRFSIRCGTTKPWRRRGEGTGIKKPKLPKTSKIDNHIFH